MNLKNSTFKNNNFTKMDCSLALMQGKSSRFYRDFGKAAGIEITENAC